jgi:hypothetical protein
MAMRVSLVCFSAVRIVDERVLIAKVEAVRGRTRRDFLGVITGICLT